MKELVTIVLPILDKPFSAAEYSILQQYQEQLGDFPITFLKGESSEMPEELKNIFVHADMVSFDDRYFKNQRAFTKLLLNPEFYQQFSWTRFLLIGTPGTGINKNELAHWCRQGYDLIQHFPDFDRELTLKDQALKRLHPDRFVRKFTREINIFDQKGAFSLRKVDTFAKKVKSKRKTIYEFLNKFPELQSDSVFWEYYVNRLTTQLIVPNAISRDRFVQSLNFLKNTQTTELPFATVVNK